MKAKDPQTYAELEASEQERRAYEHKLKRCKTKDEVQRLKMAYAGSSLAKVKSIENNPNIPQEKKLKLVMQEQCRCDKREKITQSFVRRSEYEKLPTDHEMAKAEREETKRKVQNAEGSEIPAQETKVSADEGTAAEYFPESGMPTGKPEKPIALEESPELCKTRRAKAKAAYIQTENFQDSTDSVLDIKA